MVARDKQMHSINKLNVYITYANSSLTRGVLIHLLLHEHY